MHKMGGKIFIVCYKTIGLYIICVYRWLMKTGDIVEDDGPIGICIGERNGHAIVDIDFSIGKEPGVDDFVEVSSNKFGNSWYGKVTDVSPGIRYEILDSERTKLTVPEEWVRKASIGEAFADICDTWGIECKVGKKGKVKIWEK